MLLQSSPEVEELASRPAGSRSPVGRPTPVLQEEHPTPALPSSRKVSGELGARSRTNAATPRSSRAEEEGVTVRQSSWGSRHRLEGREEGEGSFVRNRDLWERRTNSSGSDEERRGVRGFWESRANSDTPEGRSGAAAHRNPAHTPDLVMDLPRGLQIASSPPVPAPRPHLRRRSRSPSSDSGASGASSSSPPSSSVTSADNFATSTDTLRKSSGGPVARPRPPPIQSGPQEVQGAALRSPGGRLVSQGASPFNSFSPSPSSFKPQVKVKPLLHVKPSEIKKDEVKK